MAIQPAPVPAVPAKKADTAFIKSGMARLRHRLAFSFERGGRASPSFADLLAIAKEILQHVEAPTVGLPVAGIALPQTLTGAGALKLDGPLSATGVAVFDKPRRVAIASDGDDSGITWTVIGSATLPAVPGVVQTETMKAENAGEAQTALAFATVVSIEGSGAAADTVSATTATPVPADWVPLAVAKPGQTGAGGATGAASTALTVVTPSPQVAGRAFRLTGTYSGAAPTGIDVQTDVGLFSAAASPAPVIGSGLWSCRVAVKDEGSHTLTVRGTGTTAPIATTGSFVVASAATAATLSVKTPSSLIEGATISLEGAYTGIAPTGIEAQVDGSAFLAPPAPATIGGGTWSASFPGLTAGVHGITVRNAGVPAVTASTSPFTVAPAPGA